MIVVALGLNLLPLAIKEKNKIKNRSLKGRFCYIFLTNQVIIRG
jgi:hypothetical protein